MARSPRCSVAQGTDRESYNIIPLDNHIITLTMTSVEDHPKVVPIAIIEQPYSADYLAYIATFLLRAPLHVLMPITKALYPNRLNQILHETRRQPEFLPKPLERMEEMCMMLIINLNARKRRWGVTRGIVPLALLLLWKLRCAREEGKWRDAGGMMCQDQVCVVVAISRALASITDTNISLRDWSDLSGVPSSELANAGVAFENAIDHNILVTEAEFENWTWKMDELWDKVLKLPDPGTSIVFNLFGANAFWRWRALLDRLW